MAPLKRLLSPFVNSGCLKEPHFTALEGDFALLLNIKPDYAVANKDWMGFFNITEGGK